MPIWPAALGRIIGQFRHISRPKFSEFINKIVTQPRDPSLVVTTKDGAFLKKQPDSEPVSVLTGAALNQPTESQTETIKEEFTIKDGTSLTIAAQLLAEMNERSTLEIAAALRVVGYIDEVCALGEIISTAAFMQGRFERLHQILPNLPQTFKAFTLIASLDASICAPSTYEKPSAKRFRSVNRTAEGNFLQWFFFQYLPENRLDDLKSAPLHHADILAGWWIYGAAVRLYKIQIPPWRVQYQTDDLTPDNEIRAFDVLLTQSREEGAIHAGAEKAGYADWLSQMVSPDYKVEPKKPSLAKIAHVESCNLQLPAAIKRLACIREPSLSLLTNLNLLSPSVPVPPLSERELLKSHWYFPRPSEMKRLKTFLEKNREAGSPMYTEACLIGLAILSSRTVSSVVQWRIYQPLSTPPAGDCIAWSKRFSLNTKNEFLAPVWQKTEHGQGNAMAQICLPWHLMTWLAELDSGIGSPRLADLLPLSEKDWPTRAYACLADVLNCTVKRAEILSRDLLARLIYQETANSGLVKFWRSSVGDQLKRDDRIALNHYVKIQHGRCLTTFSNACREVFGNSSMDAYHRLKIPLGRPPLERRDIKLIASAFVTARAEATDAINHHRCTANLVLFFCLAGTGHRRRTTPFPFAWDFNIVERLVFIADKLITGSEARFVPLAPTVIHYLKLYAEHLRQLCKNKELGVEVRNYARLVETFLSTGTQPSKNASLIDMPLTHGVFFSVSADGQNINKRTISTHQLDAEIELLTGNQKVVQRLRPSLASYCWEAGASGRSVQTLLGHEPELHSQGPASSWCLRQWADRMESLIENYFDDCGISQPVICGPLEPVYMFGSIPHASISNDLGYEGRQREKEWGAQRAKALIRREINAHVLEDDETVFTDEDFKRIELVVRIEMSNDPHGLAQISSQIKSQLSSLRQKRSISVKAQSAFLGVTLPGPIGVEHSRLLRIAGVFRHVWEANVGVALGSKQFDSIERLAHLAISLVCFDAVLLPLHIEGIIKELQETDPETYDLGIILRSRVLSATHDYEFAVQPGLVSTALTLGSRRLPSIYTLEDVWPMVERRVALILKRLLLPAPNTKSDLQQLCLIFRPYWLIRQPAAMYAVAVGEFRGPAADPYSEAQLLGHTVNLSNIKLERPDEKSPANTTPLGSPYKELIRVFSKARGRLENAESTKKKQRAALKDALHTPETELMLTRWGDQTQTVAILCSFIERLLEQGGKRVNSLALDTLGKYFSSIAKQILSLAWHTDFETISKEDLTQLLETASQNLRSPIANTVLYYFASHLRDEVNAPYCGPKWCNSKDRVRVRASLILQSQVTKATKLLNKDTVQAARDGSLLISTMSGYGVRPKEVWGISASRFDKESQDFLVVTRTPIADLKSKSGRRVLPVSINPKGPQSVVRDALAKASTSPHSGQYLFEDSTGQAFITNTNAARQKATQALRRVTGNPIAVPYHLRHTFATALTVGLFALDNPLLEAMATRLLGSDYRKRLKDILQMPDDWPFALDAAAILMGHSGISDLLNTYGHGSCFIISAWCHRWQHCGSMTDLRFSAMLGRERTSVTKMRSRLEANRDNSSVNWEDVVLHVSKQFSEEKATDLTQQEEDLAEDKLDFDWVAISRMLLDRLKSDSSLETMGDYAKTKFRMSPELVTKIIERYAELVATTELDDFEPPSSELLRPFSSQKTGVGRGQYERDQFVARTQKWALTDPTKKTALFQFLSLWEKKVDAKNPRIICVNQIEVDQAMSLLKNLRIDASQLGFCTHGDRHTPWLESVALKHAGTTHSENRASRGSQRVLVTEVSIAVKQKAGQQVPDGRDFHRALIALCVAIAVS